jgi:uncharacterized protein YaeQ
LKFTCTVVRRMDGRELRTKEVLVSRPGEMVWHIALKLLGFMLFLEQEPRIEAGVGWKFKPDLVAFDPSGAVGLWVDCGNIAIDKIRRVAAWVPSSAGFVILRRNEREARVLLDNMKGKVPGRGRVEVRWFGKDFVNQLAGRLDANNTLHCTLYEDWLEVKIQNRHGVWETGTEMGLEVW